MSKTQERVIKVLENMTAMTEQEEHYASMFSDSLEAMIEDLMGRDAFGTEGQCDPRGDFREGDWSMDRVEGIDD